MEHCLLILLSQNKTALFIRLRETFVSSIKMVDANLQVSDYYDFSG